MFPGEAANTNLIVFDLTRLGLETVPSCTQDKHTTTKCQWWLSYVKWFGCSILLRKKIKYLDELVSATDTELSKTLALLSLSIALFLSAGVITINSCNPYLQNNS